MYHPNFRHHSLKIGRKMITDLIKWNMKFLLLVSKLKDYLKPIREMLCGMTVHEMDLELKREET